MYFINFFRNLIDIFNVKILLILFENKKFFQTHPNLKGSRT